MQTTGGRNGYGAKLTNIYSTEFVVETCDKHGSGKHYRQVTKPVSAGARLTLRSQQDLTSLFFSEAFAMRQQH